MNQWITKKGRITNKLKILSVYSSIKIDILHETNVER